MYECMRGGDMELEHEYNGWSDGDVMKTLLQRANERGCMGNWWEEVCFSRVREL